MTGFTILTVCTGNICRSAFAEQLLRVGLADLSDVRVHSVGTRAMVGYPMPEQAAALSRRNGGDPSEHSARLLTEQHVRDANLVLAMAREHRKAVVELVPRASRYTFTVREFARLVDGVTDHDLDELGQLPTDDTAGRLAASVELAASRRGTVALPAEPDDDDVVDPYGGPDDIYELSGRQLIPAVNTVLTYLRRAASAGKH